MKTIFIFFCVILANLTVNSQTKFLFDATKAESAGNADWILDADVWNLSYLNGTAIAEEGNEANAQRFPTPSQSGITSSTAENYWTGALSAWGVDLVKKGYTVETLPFGEPRAATACARGAIRPSSENCIGGSER